MKSKILHQQAPVNLITLFIDSAIEWGEDKTCYLKFIIENGLIVSADNSLFHWAIGKEIKEVENYILITEKEKLAYQKKINEDFTISQQEQLLFYEEEKKKRKWEEEHWTEIEQGDGYFD